MATTLYQLGKINEESAKISGKLMNNTALAAYQIVVFLFGKTWLNNTIVSVKTTSSNRLKGNTRLEML